MKVAVRATPALRALSLFAFLFTTAYIFLHEPPPRVVGTLGDKAVHFVVYGGMAFLLWIVARGRGHLAILAAIAAIGAADEVHQFYTPGRFGELADFIVDVLGAACVLAVVRTWGEVRGPPLHTKNGAGTTDEHG